jgi:hypothetical protein
VVVADQAGLLFKINAIIRHQRGGAQRARRQALTREQVSLFKKCSLISCHFV